MSLTRHKRLKQGGPLRPMSDKRLAKLGGWALSTFAPKRPQPAVPPQRRKTLSDRSGKVCEARLPGCWGRATDPHHRVTRKDGGRHGQAKQQSDQLSNLLHLCRSCHDYAHGPMSVTNPLGLRLYENQIPAQEPVLYRGEPSYLDDLGGVWSAEEAGA